MQFKKLIALYRFVHFLLKVREREKGFLNPVFK